MDFSANRHRCGTYSRAGSVQESKGICGWSDMDDSDHGILLGLDASDL